MKIMNICHKIILAALCVAFASCDKEDTVRSAIPAEGTMSFSVCIPDEQVVQTREAIAEGVIGNMYVLVFDHEGNFIYRSQALREQGPGNYNVRLPLTGANVPQAERSRIIHFVCNCDWSSFSDFDNLGKSENEVIPSLSVRNGTVAYWNRTVMADGIAAIPFQNAIELRRSAARISVVNATSQINGSSYVRDVYFGLGDHLDCGTVAPFNSSSLQFEDGCVTESPYASRQQAHESSFVAAGTSMSATGTPLTCYEQVNSVAANPMYVIIKARFENDSQYSYYKVDIIGDGQESLYDITRNYHYIVKIIGASERGSSTLQEAASGPASNNISFSVIFKDYTAISNGTSALHVERTAMIMVRTGTRYSISYSYIPDLANHAVTDNSLVTFNVEQDAAGPVIQGTPQRVTDPDGTTRVSFTSASSLPVFGSYVGTLTLSGPGRMLNRRIELSLRQPSAFGNVSVSAIPSQAGGAVNLTFTIPDIRQEMFPMDIYITTKGLCPSASGAYANELSLDFNEAGDYRYRYTATGKGVHTIHFQTLNSSTSEQLKIASDLFATYSLNISN